jgi:hypothetical protein
MSTMSVRQRDFVPATEVRRDCAPHRGRVLFALALSSLIVGAGSLAVAPGVLAVVMGAWVFCMARHDLRQMRAGLLDPQGLRQTFQARECAFAAIVTGCVLSGGVCAYGLVALVGELLMRSS